MTKHGHMPPVPPQNRTHKGPSENADAGADTIPKNRPPRNAAEQGDTANIRENKTNKGFFAGRRHG